MPLRYPPLSAVLRHSPCPIPKPFILPIRPFHTTLPLNHDPDKNQNHYETLNVPPTASPSEIKKSYFALSKAHHPDHNPSDPHASRRFMRISEAYSVLGHADKRARYDRDVLRRGPTPVPHHHKSGSYHSSHPAGGRPPSGLSRRRGPFQGPPPSFFRSGGWGTHSTKRKAAHKESTGTAGGGSGAGAAAGSAGAGPGGMGPGQNPWRARSDRAGDVPHFDREAHERTQRRHDKMRAERMKERGLHGFGDRDLGADYVAVLGVLIAVLVGPYLIGKWLSGGEMERKARQKKAEKG